MGEWGKRKGTEFEQSIATMLAYLGFKITAEFTAIKCFDPNHKVDDHSIDFLAEHSGPNPRPLKSYDGLTFFDCTSRENVPDNQFEKVSQTLECLRKTEPYTNTKGAVIVTSVRLTPGLSKALSGYSDIICWDASRLHLYGSLAMFYILGTRKRQNVRTTIENESSTIIVLREPAPTFPWRTFEGDLFYEGDVRLNRDYLKKALLGIRCVASELSITYVRVHSISGFTSDLPKILNTIVKECSSWRQRIIVRSEDLFDYTRPWFAAFLL